MSNPSLSSSCDSQDDVHFPGAGYTCLNASRPVYTHIHRPTPTTLLRNLHQISRQLTSLERGFLDIIPSCRLILVVCTRAKTFVAACVCITLDPASHLLGRERCKQTVMTGHLYCLLGCRPRYKLTSMSTLRQGEAGEIRDPTLHTPPLHHQATHCQTTRAPTSGAPDK